uniref:Uncharacterized protein n=1 Tax=Musa acuminata subsp. malaccensis TaxID=214687 RepID=A0A804IFD3_MUSAM
MSSWILAGLGSLGSSLIGRVKDQISDYLIGRVLEDPGVADLHELRNTLSGTERIIGRVENMWIKDEDKKKRLKELLMKLKDTVYDADDLLDEIQFRVLKQQIEQQGAQGRFFGREYDVIRMITSVVPRTTTSFPIETQVFGRDEQLNHLLEQLMKSADGSGSSNSSISTVTIVGIGGVGKTTLAQQAYNHERVKDYFHPKVWLCVSDNFNEVKEKLTSKRYGEPGSKILVTTRSKKIAEMVGNPIPLYLEAIAKKIAGRLKGLPLAARTQDEEGVLPVLQLSYQSPVGSKYVMHDLIHDLAQFISEGEFCRIDDDDHWFGFFESPLFIQFEKLKNIRWLTESLCDLYNLRVLDLSECDLQSLPHGMSNLKQLHGQLRITNLENEVLEGLQPHQALKRLTIRGYIGVRSPSWLQTQLLANLITLDLYN